MIGWVRVEEKLNAHKKKKQQNQTTCSATTRYIFIANAAATSLFCHKLSYGRFRLNETIAGAVHTVMLKSG